MKQGRSSKTLIGNTSTFFRFYKTLPYLVIEIGIGVGYPALALAIDVATVTSPSLHEIASPPTLAQVISPLPPDFNELDRPDLQTLPDRPDLQPLPETLPPPLPLLPVEPAPPPSGEPSPSTLTVEVRQITIRGNTVFREQELAAVVAPFIGRQATFEDLLAIRTAVTDFYTSNGYTTSGAFLPPQDVADGEITVQVVEGELERIEIQGLRQLRPSYVRDRITLAAGPPVNIRELEQALQLLQLDPLFQSIQAELIPGTTAGRSILVLNLREAPVVLASLGVDNRDSPSTGSTRGTATLSHENLLGLGDRLSSALDLSEGSTSYTVGYSLPLNPRDGTLSLSYSRSDSEIIEPPFAAFDINSNSETLSLGFRQPLTRTPTNEFALGLTLDLRRSQTFLQGDRPFSFSEGAEDGLSRVTVLRFSQDWLDRSPSRVLAARSQFSLGLNLFDATINASGTDGEFFSWVGQFQWVESLGNHVLAIARVSAQLTGDSLLPLEQFSIGGIDTVRGYRQNQRVGDNGVVGSMELRLPIVQDPDGVGLIQLTPFFDIGRVWDTNGAIPSPRTLMSTGVGLRWQLDSRLEARLEYGIPLKPIDQPGDSLQDAGLFFSFRMQLF